MIILKELEVYQLSRKLSKFAWNVYDILDWRMKKIIGDQFIESTDSIGANIAESYGRFHFLDRIKFFYNSRGSLLESRHWLELLKERNLIKDMTLETEYLNVYEILKPKLNNFINSLYRVKKSSV